MSHTTKITGIAIRDVAAIRSAVADLNAKGVAVELLENAMPRMYYRAGVNGKDQHGKCAFVLRLTGEPGGEREQYDLGLDLQEDGTYAPIFDEWDNHVANQLGADVNVCPIPSTPEGRAQHQIGSFVQKYATHAAINAAKAKGYSIKGTTFDHATGAVHVQIGGIR